MDMLLKEMQEMDKFVQQPIQAPSVINEVAKLKQGDQIWPSAGLKSEESMADVCCMVCGLFHSTNRSSSSSGSNLSTPIQR
jgi:hypothetical protein